MDTIDSLLEEAFLRLLDRLRDNPALLLRRLNRRRLATLTRPLRAWCLCLRASDTRIRNERTALFDEHAADRKLPHTVILNGWGIRRLVSPVEIAWPGIRLRDAARKLGMDDASLAVWVRKGVFKLEHDYCRPHGYCGRKCPILWTHGPLDPNSKLGRPPDPLWGSLWQYQASQLPEQFTCTLQRTPRITSHNGQPQTRGWNWLCPGLLGKNCGRTVRRVYSPVSPWTLPRALLPDHLRNPAADKQFLDALLSAQQDPLEGKRTFACQHCWKPQNTFYSDNRLAWGQFIAHISAGLLYGHEVPMPEDFRAAKRRRRNHRPHADRRSPLVRRWVRRMWTATDLSARHIGQQLGLSDPAVRAIVRSLYAQHDVHSRRALAHACARKPPPSLLVNLDSRRQRVSQLFATGHSMKQIAAELKIPTSKVGADLQHTHARLGTHNRASLRAALATRRPAHSGVRRLDAAFPRRVSTRPFSNLKSEI